MQVATNKVQQDEEDEHGHDGPFHVISSLETRSASKIKIVSMGTYRRVVMMIVTIEQPRLPFLHHQFVPC